MTLDPMQWFAGIAVIAAGVAGLVYLTRGVWRVFKKIDYIKTLLERVESEFRANGGASLRDAVDEVRADLKAHKEMHATQDAARR